MFQSVIYDVLIGSRQGAIGVGPVLERLLQRNIDVGARAALKRDKFNLETLPAAVVAF